MTLIIIGLYCLIVLESVVWQKIRNFIWQFYNLCYWWFAMIYTQAGLSFSETPVSSPTFASPPTTLACPNADFIPLLASGALLLAASLFLTPLWLLKKFEPDYFSWLIQQPFIPCFSYTNSWSIFCIVWFWALRSSIFWQSDSCPDCFI